MNIGPRRLGKYELYEPLGRGSMAEVWKAFDGQLGRYVAIKLLHANLQNEPDFTKRFTREARVVASLYHPNILRIHDFQASAPESGNSDIYMVMDYVEGQTLAQYIRDTSSAGKFPPAAEIVYLFTCMGSAIDYAHRQGVIHRDIKPSNILLDKRSSSRYQIGLPILSDFGIVKLLGASTSTLSGWWLGTPLYTSPEQAQGHSGDERSDIYSLGVILYEICTGVRPFKGDNVVSIFVQQINTMPTSPDLINSNIPPALTDVIMRSLAKDPAARFPNASSIAVALAKALNLPVPANAGMLTSPADAPSRLTFRNRSQPDLLPGEAPSLSPLSPSGPPSAPLPTAFTPEFGRSIAQPHAGYLSDGRGMPTMPLNNITEVPTIVYSRQHEADVPPLQSPQELLPAMLSASRKRRKGMLVTLCVLLILVLAGSSSGVFAFISSKDMAIPAASQLVGNAFYVNSGELGGSSSQGIEDQFQIDLHNVPDLAPDKRYYAWLLSDNNPSPKALCGTPPPTSSILLGPLSINHSTIHFLYPGNQQHTNLIGTTSRFLITEESASSKPDHPSTDKLTWRYYAELPQAFDPNNQDYQSAIIRLRCLLFESALLQTSGLQVGLGIQFYRNTQMVLEWANRAIKDNKDPVSIHRQIVSILDYLDGLTLVQRDVSGIPVLVDTRLASIPLLSLEPGQDTCYIVVIHKLLLGIAESPDSGVTAKMRELATHAAQALINVQNWLETVHQDAKQLVGLPEAQLLDSSSLFTLKDLENQANNAFNGQIDPFTRQVRSPGVVQILSNIQSLANFDVMTYTPR